MNRTVLDRLTRTLLIAGLGLLACGCLEAEPSGSDEPAASPAHAGHVEVGSVPPELRAVLPKAEFSLKFRDEVSNYDVIGVFVMPGETIEFETVFERGNAEFGFDCPEGELENLARGRWKWTAPSEPGHYPMSLRAEPSGHEVLINAFVKVPTDHIRDGRLNEFRVGTYPSDDEFGKRANYERPDGFIEVNERTREVLISPHFRLGQFVSKQASNYPKYVFLRERLLLKLELIFREFNDAGIETENIHIMSGYRTPFYNKSIGNVKFSRHVFGDAADIFIDNDNNGRMDDITGDGSSDLADAMAMAVVIEALADEERYGPFLGGLGIYGPKPHRGPFIHVDTRGYKARWTNP